MSLHDLSALKASILEGIKASSVLEGAPVLVEVCKSCDRKLPERSIFFCPHCGTACLENLLLQPAPTATTQYFDPLNPMRKAWRDKPPTAIFPPIRQATMSTSHQQPWCPAMKQAVRKTKTKRKKAIAPDDSVRDYADLSSLPPSIAIDTQRRESLPPIEPPQMNEAMMSSRHRSGLESTDSYKDEYAPIAVYVAEWLPFKKNIVPIINLSLIRRKYHDSRRHDRLWLRVGFILEKESDNVSEAAVVPEEMAVLDLIPNSVGRAIRGRDRDWVELNTISTGEFYVTAYLQRSLDQLARRVSLSCSSVLHDLTDQHLSVAVSSCDCLPSECSCYRKTYAAVFYRPQNLNGKGFSMHQARIGDVVSQSSQAAAIHFESVVMQLACRIAVGPSYTGEKMMALVRLYFIYGGQSPLLQPESENMEAWVSDNSRSALKNGCNATEDRRSKIRGAEEEDGEDESGDVSTRATHVALRLTFDYAHSSFSSQRTHTEGIVYTVPSSPSSFVHSKVVIFEASALTDLLQSYYGDETEAAVSNRESEVSSDAQEVAASSLDCNISLEMGPKALVKFTRRVCNLLWLEEVQRNGGEDNESKAPVDFTATDEGDGDALGCQAVLEPDNDGARPRSENDSVYPPTPSNAQAVEPTTALEGKRDNDGSASNVSESGRHFRVCVYKTIEQTV